MKHLFNLLGFAGFSTLGVFTIMGKTQEVIKFSSVDGEMVFTVFSFFLAFIFLISSFLSDPEDKK